MRLPRVRFTVGWMMVMVAVVAAILYLYNIYADFGDYLHSFYLPSP